MVRGRPGGLLQSSEGEAVMILLASVSSGILAIWPNRERLQRSNQQAAGLGQNCGCSLWSRSVMLESAESKHPGLTNHEIIFKEFQPTSM